MKITSEFVTLQQAATYLSVSRSTVERYCLDGYLTYRKLPPVKGKTQGYTQVNVESLEEFKNAYTHDALPVERRKGRAPILKAVR